VTSVAQQADRLRWLAIKAENASSVHKLSLLMVAVNSAASASALKSFRMGRISQS
jgi:hypothetical protein